MTHETHDTDDRDGLDGRAALVTGGGSGIGAALVEQLTAGGASVLALDRDAQRVTAIAEATGCRSHVGDVATIEGNEAAVSAVIGAFGRLDLAFLNAGVLGRPYPTIGDPYGAGDIDLELYQRVRAINLDGVVYGTIAAAAAMKGSGGGSIIATASTAGLTAWTPTPMYTATKHGVVGWVRAMGPALAAEGIRLNAICPAGVATPLVGRTSEDVGARLLAPSTVAAAMIDTALGDAVGQAVTVVAGREPVWMAHEFSDVPGFP